MIAVQCTEKGIRDTALENVEAVSTNECCWEWAQNQRGERTFAHHHGIFWGEGAAADNLHKLVAFLNEGLFLCHRIAIHCHSHSKKPDCI